MSVFGAADLLAMKIRVEVLGELCYKFCTMGGFFGWSTKNPADLMMRLFQVDWIEIILCIRNFMTSVIMEMDEDIIVIPLQCQSMVAVV